MNHYRYVNNRNRIIIFECDAPNILMADEIMQNATGINPIAKYIAVELTKAEKPSWRSAVGLRGIYARLNIGSVWSRIRKRLKLKKPADA